MKNRSHFLPVWFFGLLSLLAGFRFLSGLDKTVYQCDEYSYLRKSYFLDLFLEGKFSDPQWQEGDAKDQTKLMEYIYGLPSKILYGKDFIELASEESLRDKRSYINYGDWAVTYGQSAANLQVSQKLKNVLYGGRLISAVLTVVYLILTSLALFWLSRGSYLITVSGFLFLLTHPIVTIHGKQVLADSALNLWLVLGLLVILLWWRALFQRQDNRRQLLGLGVISGIVGGLAAATKLNGFSHVVLSSFVFAVAGGIVWGSRKALWQQKLTMIVISSLLSLGVAGLIFIALHPNTWGNPYLGIKQFVDWRWWITEYYQDYFPEDKISGWLEAWRYLLLRVPGYMPGVGSIGFHYEQQFKSAAPVWYVLPNLVLVMLGLWEIGQRLLTKGKFMQITFPAFLWSLGQVIIVSYYLKLDWTRYYWPLLAPFLVINGFGLLFVTHKLKQIWQIKKL